MGRSGIIVGVGVSMGGWEGRGRMKAGGGGSQNRGWDGER